jgi:hypothetical protein
MPDEWELANQLDPADPADAAQDADGDGCTNLQEFRAGTHPRDPASVFKFTLIAPQGNVLRLQFPVVAGRSYTVQYQDNLAGANWVRLEDVPSSPTNGVADLLDATTPPAAQRFYRVITPAQP